MLDSTIVIWFLGKPGAGKTTLARGLSGIFNSWGVKNIVLDAEEIRSNFYPDLRFSENDRKMNIARLVELARMFSGRGIIPLVAAVTPYEDIRAAARNALPKYFEVYVDCSLETLATRRPEIYRGPIAHFVGDNRFEEPRNPDAVIYTRNSMSIVPCLTQLLYQLAFPDTSDDYISN